MIAAVLFLGLGCLAFAEPCGPKPGLCTPDEATQRNIMRHVRSAISSAEAFQSGIAVYEAALARGDEEAALVALKQALAAEARWKGAFRTALNAAMAGYHIEPPKAGEKIARPHDPDGLGLWVKDVKAPHEILPSLQEQVYF